MFICLVAGQLVRRYGKFNDAGVRTLNIFILSVSLPAVIFVEVPPLFRTSAFSHEIMFAIAMPWVEFLTAVTLLTYVGRRLQWSRGLVGSLILTAGLANTSFIGLPVVDTLFGKAGVSIAILIDQLGTFFILATLGLVTASICAGRSLRVHEVLRRILLFPPFVSFVIASLWGLSPLPLDGLIKIIFQKVGLSLIPLALASVGWQLDVSRSALRAHAKPLAVGLGFKLVLWPGLIFMTYLFNGSAKTLIAHVTLIEAAMGPMITGAIIASEFNLAPEFAQLMVGLGIPLSIVTLTGWSLLLHGV